MRTYLKVALRNLRREKLYAALNIAGLALGIACCLMLALYLWSEFTYDRHHANHERIYRVAQRIGDISGDDEYRLSATSPALGVMLAEDYPEVILEYVRFRMSNSEMVLRNEDQAYYWGAVHLVDDNVFDVFTYEITHGDPRTALTEPNTIAISRSLAQRYFGDANPIGQTLYDLADNAHTVTLVYEDLPHNTHLKSDALMSNKGRVSVPDDINARRRTINVTDTYTYLLLPEGYDSRNYDELSRQFEERHLAEIARPMNIHWESWLQPLASIHLHSDLMLDQPTGNRLYLYALAAVGVFILGIACINYVNLATARAARRARAIGLRKILGVERRSLIAQLLAESVLFALLATVVGVIAVEVLVTLPAVTALFGQPLELDVFGEPLVGGAILAFGVLVGVAAGLYPALQLSAFVPLSALVGRYQTKARGLRLRETLVLVQFAISVGVIAATLLMTAQMRFIANKALGFEADNRIIVPLRGADLIEQQNLIAAELSSHPGVLGVTTSERMMGGSLLRTTRTPIETDEGTTRELMYGDIGDVGADFVSVMGMKIVQGRDFSEAMGTDSNGGIIVNETFVSEMGWKEPVGKRIGPPDGPRSGQVIGVVEDFHFHSLHERIQPLAIFRNDADDFSGLNPAIRGFQERLMIINMAREGLRDTLSYIEGRFRELDPGKPFEFEFLDESLQQLYMSEQRMMRLVGIFATICILVASLGLFGLSAFATEQRTKEIGIRKVLGATVSEIILLLSRRVLLLIAIGGAVAAVVTWILMLEWLSGFAYHAPVNPGYFIVAVTGAGAVALGTIALQSWRTARADPVEALRYE